MSSAQMSSDVIQSNNVASKHERKLNEMLSQMERENNNDRESSQSSKPRMLSARSFGGGAPRMMTRSSYSWGYDSDEDNEPIRCVPKCRMANFTKGDVFQTADQDWKGSNVGAYPIRIIRNSIGGFRHGDVDDSEGAVLYRTSNGTADCCYLLAWQATEEDKKVYCEAGPVERYKNISWDDVKTKLNEHGGPRSHCLHRKSGAEMSAQVGKDEDFIAAVVFDYTK